MVKDEVSYDKLWRLLRKNGMKKTDLYTKLGLSTNAIAKMGKGQFVNLGILVKICRYFDCGFDEVVELVKD